MFEALPEVFPLRPPPHPRSEGHRSLRSSKPAQYCLHLALPDNLPRPDGAPSSSGLRQKPCRPFVYIGRLLLPHLPGVPDLFRFRFSSSTRAGIAAGFLGRSCARRKVPEVPVSHSHGHHPNESQKHRPGFQSPDFSDTAESCNFLHSFHPCSRRRSATLSGFLRRPPENLPAPHPEP